MGMKRGWSGRREKDGFEMLLGFEMLSLLTLKRSAIEAKSRYSGGLGL